MIIQIFIGPDFDVRVEPHFDDSDEEAKMMPWFQKYKPVFADHARQYLSECGFRKIQVVDHNQRHPERTECLSKEESV